jgi:hypothetical protein
VDSDCELLRQSVHRLRRKNFICYIAESLLTAERMPLLAGHGVVELAVMAVVLTTHYYPLSISIIIRPENQWNSMQVN